MAADEIPAGLTDELVEAGRRLLAAADELGLEAQGAAWIYVEDMEEWRYFLVTALVDSEGPLWVYRRLLKAFNKLPEREDFLSVDVQIASPNEMWFGAIMVMLNMLGISAAMQLTIKESEVHADGVVYKIKCFHGCVYRMGPLPPADTIKRIRNKFERNVHRLAVA